MYRNLRLILFVLVLVSIFVGMGMLSAQPSNTSPYLRSVTLPIHDGAGVAYSVER